MPLPSPNLDDRRFEDLLQEAQRRIRQTCPEWTDLSPGDPGTVLMEVFAHLTEVMIYRLNRLPEKAYIEFLRLLGVKLRPPSAAIATLRFTLKAAQDKPVKIPRGTRVAAERSGADAEVAVFATAESATIGPGTTAVEVTAYHCDMVQAEPAGEGTGLPGLSLRVRRPPIVAPTGDGLDLVVGVEARDEELGPTTPARRQGGKTYRIWREVEGFTELGEDAFVYVADRAAGLITFAPALRMQDAGGALEDVPRALGEVPAAGREVRVWYRTGGGPAGDVAADTLKTLKDPVPGVHLDVTNPSPASGGAAAETLENALRRGPQELHSLRRAVTARDFELLAEASSGGVNRARAYTKATLWKYAQPGTVEVVLVPSVPEENQGQGPVTPEMLRAHETEATRTQIQEALEHRRPLGTTCLTKWSGYKAVQVRTRVVVHREEDPAAVGERVLRRLYDTINPLSRPPDSAGWPFGQSLSAYHVYRILGTEPGVKNVEPVRLRVADVPGADVKTLSADDFQPHTWYAGLADVVYRSGNDGEGWEPIARFPGERVVLVKAYPRAAGTGPGRAGRLAIATQVPGPEGGSRVHLSRDCGESWEAGPRTQFRIEDMAWLDRDGVTTLMLATEVGLYELAGRTEALPVQILVDPQNQKLGFYAIAISTDVLGKTSVALAARARGGVYLSGEGGAPNTFRHIGLKNEKVRLLAVQHRGPHRYLWAGFEASGDDPGEGCARWELSGAADSPGDWQTFDQGWRAGGCRSLAFLGSTVLAASLRLGILTLDTGSTKPRWNTPDVSCGLPLLEMGRMERVDCLAAAPAREEGEPTAGVILAGGPRGVYRSRDGGTQYEESSSREFADEVTLPQSWLFCSAEHDVQVVSEDETQ